MWPGTEWTTCDKGLEFQQYIGSEGLWYDDNDDDDENDNDNDNDNGADDYEHGDDKYDDFYNDKDNNDNDNDYNYIAHNFDNNEDYMLCQEVKVCTYPGIILLRCDERPD